MKKIFVFISFITLFFVFNITLKAECTDNNIINEGKKVTLVSELVEEENYFKIKIDGITENIYVNLFESDHSTTTKYDLSKTLNGSVSIDHFYIYEKVTYTASVYSSSETCKDELLNTLTITTPKYNFYSQKVLCEENPEYEKCNPFYEGESITDETFDKEINEYIEEKNMTITDKIFDFLSNYYLYIVIPFGVLVIFFIVRIIIIKKKVKK